MAVVLTPSTTLGFERPLTRLVPQTLSVHNPNSQPAVVKIKTTAPKSYSVRPSAARVEPGETLDIHIVLQALKEEPPAGSRSRDKFLVQSTLLTPERETLGIHDVWGSVPASEVHEHKVRVAWVGEGPAAAAAAAAAAPAPAPATAGNGHASSASPASPVAAGAAGAGAAGAAGLGAAGAGLASPVRAASAASPAGVSPGAGDPVLPSRSLVAPAPAAAPGAAAAPEKPLSTSELEAKVKALQDQVAVAQSERGVPTQTVALISLFIFVLTYIFF